MPRHLRRSAAVSALVVSACVAIAACGSAPATHPDSAAHPTGSVHHNLYFRPVLCIIPRFSPKASPETTPPGSSYSSLCSDPGSSGIPTTPLSSDSATQDVVLPFYTNGSARYVLGPADLTGTAIAKAQSIVTSSGQYQVMLTFTAEGAALFDAVAAQRYSYYQQDPSNPPYQSLEAIELDGQVLSAPTIQAAKFNGNAVISGSSSEPFTERQTSAIVQEIQLAAK